MKFCTICRIATSIIQNVLNDVQYEFSWTTRQRANCEVYLWDYFRVQQYNRMKDLYYPAVLRLGIMRSEVAVERKGQRGISTSRNEERVTQRNGVSKEGARRASDKPHNALAWDDPPGFMHASKSPWRMRLGMRFLARVCCVPRLPRAKSRGKERRLQRARRKIPRRSRDYLKACLRFMLVAGSYFPFQKILTSVNLTIWLTLGRKKTQIKCLKRPALSNCYSLRISHIDIWLD